MYVIIKTPISKKRKDGPNWSGKEWSELPAKIYSSFQDATDAIKHYWYGGYNLENFDNRQVIFVPLTESKMQKLIQDKKARL